MQVQINIHNSAGELVRHFTGLSFGPGSSFAFIPGTDHFNPAVQDGADLVLRYGSAGEQVLWDGRDDQGCLVAAGTYVVSARQLGSSPNSAVLYSENVVLLNGGSSNPLAGAYAVPNPVFAGGNKLSILLPAWASGLPVQARIFNLGGELVAQLSVPVHNTRVFC